MSQAAVQTPDQNDAIKAPLLAALEKQRQSFVAEGFVSGETRIDRLNRLEALLMENMDAMSAAMSKDFGHRSEHQSRMADFFGTLEAIRHNKKSLQKWMKAEKRKVAFPQNLFGAKARIEYQPKGVVANITTWNFPVFVALGPLAAILAAGNRCMIKFSEVTPHSAELVKELIAKYFDETEVVVVTGDIAVGQAFSELPFDHLLFTGATSVAKHIMRAASANLTPVTLELGGKSPVIVGRSYDLKEAALRILSGKLLNAGQVCISPDYCFVPKESMDEFLGYFKAHFEEMFPNILNNPDYTSIVNQRHYQRLNSFIDDAKAQNADVRMMNPANEDFSQQQDIQRLPLHLVVDPSNELKVMQEELFGSILCIKPYDKIEDCINFINDRPRPLAMYYFSKDKAEEHKVLTRTTAGGMTVNDVMQHVGCEDLPFGGIGDSGMGHYHGIEGFKTFSHAKSVFTQANINLMKLGGMLPPYGDKAEAQLKRMLK